MRTSSFYSLLPVAAASARFHTGLPGLQHIYRTDLHICCTPVFCCLLISVPSELKRRALGKQRVLCHFVHLHHNLRFSQNFRVCGHLNLKSLLAFEGKESYILLYHTPRIFLKPHLKFPILRFTRESNFAAFRSSIDLYCLRLLSILFVVTRL